MSPYKTYGRQDHQEKCQAELLWVLISDLVLEPMQLHNYPDGHPNSPTFGHFKLPHPDERVTVQ
jgi:hypothetical protein